MSSASFVAASIKACQAVAAMLQKHVDDQRAYEYYGLGEGGDQSSGFDLMAESIFLEILEPFGTIVSEESGTVGNTDQPYTVILDPIDGSDNLKSRFPYYGASIALQHHGQTIAGVICNFPARVCFVRHDEQYYRCSLEAPALREAVVPNGNSKIGLVEKAYSRPDYVQLLKDAGLKFRAPGAVAVSMAYVPYVDYLLFFGRMRTYDLEAGLFLCQDLYQYLDDELMIVTKERTTFDRLLNLFNKEPI